MVMTNSPGKNLNQRKSTRGAIQQRAGDALRDPHPTRSASPARLAQTGVLNMAASGDDEA
jgi:hypothetical protein